MSSALIVIDVQNCFLPGGNLATVNSRNSELKPSTLAKGICNFIAKNNPENIFVTKDWHTPGHASFATNENPAFSDRVGFYTGRATVKERSWVNPARLDQKMWPAHCVQGSDEANLDKQLITCLADKTNVEYVLKGHEPNTDSYSAVANALGDFTPYMADINNQPINMKFIERLQNSDIKTVYISGIARNVCVLWTALDLLDFWILEDYIRNIRNNSEYKPIKLIFLYDLTRPVAPAPGLDISKDDILDKVLELFKNKLKGLGLLQNAEIKKNSNVINNMKKFTQETNFIKQFFEIRDSGLYKGGKQSTETVLVQPPEYSKFRAQSALVPHSGGKRKSRKRKTRRCCAKKMCKKHSRRHRYRLI